MKPIPHFQQVGRNQDGTRREWRAGEPPMRVKCGNGMRSARSTKKAERRRLKLQSESPRTGGKMTPSNYTRSRSKYVPHQGKREMARRAAA